LFGAVDADVVVFVFAAAPEFFAAAPAFVVRHFLLVVEQVFGVEFGVSVFELVVGSVFFVEFFYADGDVFLG